MRLRTIAASLLAAALGFAALPAAPAFARSGNLTLPFNVGKGFQRIPTGGNQPEEAPRPAPVYQRQIAPAPTASFGRHRRAEP